MVRVLAFDVFETVVDWRSSVIAEGERLGRKKKLRVDWAAFMARDFADLAAQLGA